ncbi:acetate--CoA ligase family protein [Prosthecochloris sp. SCSIO W1103]|uniref:ATP-binding protein n=1 Tax=Prosthecochloris sp. SCSIO W1103 TaxID=2992244 RepID=UPI00223CB598|nr:acetate--CoA ligase family protein [Prosthecochloris sp. SCSIO W1103]UZJ38184.1 hypothetical protein OO005_02990 [Prosthecochloris sp. SCSIO W1103]
MNDSVTQHNAWSLAEKTVVLNGYAYGSHYPVIIASVTGHALEEEQLATLTQLLYRAVPVLERSVEAPVTTSDNDFRRSLEWLLNTIHAVQRTANLPVYEHGRILSIEQDHARFFLPTGIGNVKPLLDMLRVMLELMGHHAQGKDAQKQLKKFVQAIIYLQKTSPKGGNIPFFIQAALKAGIPFQELLSQTFQYGEGKQGRWMRSSLTEETTMIATTFSRNKLIGSMLLRRAGIPVPDNKIAINAEKAARIAENLGYPVVVKPIDRDGGIGVAADLQNHEELITAFKNAQKYSKNILVEKHFEGKDYRVTVFQNEVLSAVERVPGGVTGDGKHTVRELFDQLNADPLRGEGKHAPLKKMMWNNEALILLKHAGLNESSIPAPGEFVRLRRTANVASGGVPVAVFDTMHPDNKHLAIRAAQALRLDLAGVDILIPDIATSWRESGAAICEVNGQPNLGRITEEKDLFTPILRKLIPGDGRIPIAVVFGDPSSDALAVELEKQLLKQGIGVGCHNTECVRINGEVVMDGNVNPWTAGQMLLLNQNVEAIVLNISDESILSTGLPFARFDLFLLAGEHITASDNTGNPASDNITQDLLELILPACDGTLLSIESDKPNTDGYKHLTSAAREKAATTSEVIETATAAMLAFREKHFLSEKSAPAVP